MRNIIKLNILFLLISFLLSGCNRTQCIEADDFGFASVTVSARYPNNDSTKYINSYQNKDMGAWLDTGFFLTGAPLTIMVNNWTWNLNLGVTSNNTGAHLSAWTPWFGSGKYYNYLPASVVKLRSCIFGTANSTTCFAAGTPDSYRIINAPCLMTKGIGLYGLIQQDGALSPNTSVTTQASPTGYTFHVGAKENNAGLFDSTGGAGGIVVSSANNQDISSYAGGKLFLKILDVNYGDNAGQYIVKIKSGVRNLGVDPFKAFADKFQQIIFAGNGTTPGIVPTIYGNILEQTGFLKAVNAVLTLYIFFTGAGFLIGIVHFTAWEVLNRVIKILVIGALLSPNSWSYFSSYLFNIFMYGANQIIGMIEYAATGGYTSGGESIIALLFAEETLAKLSSLLWMDFTGIMYVLFFVFLILLVVYIYLKAWIFFVTASLFVGVMLSLTPVFLCFMLFGWTHHLYKGWLDKLIAYSMQPIILFTALAFLGSMIRSEIYNTLGFKVCIHDVFSISITDNPYSLLKMYYPEPITDKTKHTIAVPKPWTNSASKQCRAYECQDERYLELPYLDPSLPEDAARINAFNSGKYVHFDALFYLILTAIIMLFFNDAALSIATGIFGGGLSAAAANAAAKGAAKYAWDATKYVGGKAAGDAAKNLRDNLRTLGSIKDSASSKAKVGLHEFKERANPNSDTNIKNKMSDATKKRVDAKIALDEAKARQAKLTEKGASGKDLNKANKEVASLQKSFDQAQKREEGIINKLKTSKEIGKDLNDQKEKLTKLISEGGDKGEIKDTQQKIERLIKAEQQAQKREGNANKTTAQKILGDRIGGNLGAANKRSELGKDQVDGTGALAGGKKSDEIKSQLDAARKAVELQEGKLTQVADVRNAKGQLSTLMSRQTELAEDMRKIDSKGKELDKSLKDSQNKGNQLQQKLEKLSNGKESKKNNKKIANVRKQIEENNKQQEALKGQIATQAERKAEVGAIMTGQGAQIKGYQEFLAKTENQDALKVLSQNTISQGIAQRRSDSALSKAQSQVIKLEKQHQSALAQETRKEETTKAREAERLGKLGSALAVQSSTEKATVQTRVAESVREQVRLTAKLDKAQDRGISSWNVVGKLLNDRDKANLQATLDKQGAVLGQVSQGDGGQIKELMESTRVDAVKEFNQNATRDVTKVVSKKSSIVKQLSVADKKVEKLQSEISQLRDNVIQDNSNRDTDSKFTRSVATLSKDIHETLLNRKVKQLEGLQKSVTKLEAQYGRAEDRENRLVKLDVDEVYRAQHKAQMAQDPKKPDMIDHQITKARNATSQARTELYEGFTKRGYTADSPMTRVLKENYDRTAANEQKVLKGLADQGIDVTSRLGGGAQDKLQQRMIQDETKVAAKRETTEKQLGSIGQELEKGRGNLETQTATRDNIANVQNAQVQLTKLEKNREVLIGDLVRSAQKDSSPSTGGQSSGPQSDKKQLLQDTVDVIRGHKEFLAQPENQAIANFLGENKGAQGSVEKKISRSQKTVSKLEQQESRLERQQNKADAFTKGLEGFKDLMSGEKPSSSQSPDKDSGSKKKDDTNES